MKSPARHRTFTESAGSAGTTPAGRPGYLVLCVLLVALAAVLVGRYLTQSPRPPTPPRALGAIPAAVAGPAAAVVATSAPAPVLPDPAAATTPVPVVTRTPATPTPTPLPAPPMRSSLPVSIRVPAVGIHSKLGQVGLNNDGTIEVPSSYTEAAWYRHGPTPGALGPAVLLGHVDSYKGPAVFFNVGAMQPGQLIYITRADGSTAQFRVDAIDTYAKDNFPTKAVYGPINYAGLRLVTCGGAFDKKTRSYESNTVVFASLTRS